MRIWLETPRGEYEVDHLTLMLVRDNAAMLQAQGLYERALLDAFVETSHATWSLADLYRLFEHADPVRLAAAGDPLPGPGPFTLCRGVAGDEPDRRTRGLSWTRSLDEARWFATEHSRRFREWMTDPDPGIYRVIVPAGAVLAYTNRKQEEEFIVLLPHTAPLDRVE